MNLIMIKIHGAVVLLSLAVYLVRVVLMVFGSQSYNSKTMIGAASLSMLAIFGTGIALVMMLGLDYFGGFALTKMIGLVLYVILGIIALRPGQSKIISIILWLMGLAVFAYTFMVGEQLLQPLF